MVGFEAGALTQYLTYGLQAAGFEVVCLEARQVSAALAAMRNKTDKKDARGIAQILRTGWYSRVQVKSLESHQIRALSRVGRRSSRSVSTSKTSSGGCSGSSVFGSPARFLMAPTTPWFVSKSKRSRYSGGHCYRC